MTTVRKWVTERFMKPLLAWSCVLVGVVALAACGGTNQPPVGPEEETLNYGQQNLFKDEVTAPRPNALTISTDPTTCTSIFTDPTTLLARFWTLDRFLLDPGEPVRVRQSLSITKLAKAAPDECFNGVGQPIGKPDANGGCATGQPKVNDAYVWGLAKYDGKLFFGTLANTHCLVMAGYLGIDTAQLTSEWVCEFSHTASPFHGDFRPPNMFVYDLQTRTLTTKNPTPYSAADILRMGTTGLRSAGTLPGSGVVFLAGPGSKGGVNFFALDAATGDLLPDGYFTLGAPAATTNSYNNVRMWTVANGSLYVGVGRKNGGAVLRWTGSKANPNSFIEVGYLPGDAANMILHSDGRIYITTWPNGGIPTGLFRSPVIPEGGLTELDANNPDWTTPLWLATASPAYPGVPAYDPDVVTGSTVGGGAIASFDGKLYFGTMSVPFVAAQAASEVYSIPGSDLLRTALGTHRSIAIFEVSFLRVRNR